jgi:competence protein ComGC
MTDRNRTYLFIVVAFVVGLLIGWFLLGWQIAPVQWSNATMQDLRAADQQMFLATQAEAYALTQNNRMAVERLQTLGTQQAVAELAGQVVQQAEAAGDVVTADRIRAMAASLGLTIPAAAPDATPAAPAAEQPEEGGSNLFTVLGLLLLVGGIVLAAWLLLRGRSAQDDDADVDDFATEVLLEETPAAPPAGRPAAPAGSAAAAAERGSAGQEFMAAFDQGDVSYDQSFDIEGSDGTYWGECGLTMSETVQGDPERVTALEVWLFDKSDIRTVTKVLMSDYAYGNQALREKLSSRGDAVLLAPDLGFVLDAQTLRLMGKIVAMDYDDSQAPARGAIRRLRVQLRVMRQAR